MIDVDVDFAFNNATKNEFNDATKNEFIRATKESTVWIVYVDVFDMINVLFEWKAIIENDVELVIDAKTTWELFVYIVS